MSCKEIFLNCCIVHAKNASQRLPHFLYCCHAPAGSQQRRVTGLCLRCAGGQGSAIIRTTVQVLRLWGVLFHGHADWSLCATQHLLSCMPRRCTMPALQDSACRL